jgi:hypothetical protein
MTKSNSYKVRCDPHIWESVKKETPNMTDRKRMELLVNTSPLKLVDKVGDFLYGRKNWTKIKKR